MKKHILTVLILSLFVGMGAYLAAVQPVLDRFDVTSYLRPKAPEIGGDVEVHIKQICVAEGIDWGDFLVAGNGQVLFDAREVPAADLRFVKRLVISWYLRAQKEEDLLQAFLESVDLSQCSGLAKRLRQRWLSGARLTPDAAEAIFLCGYEHVRGLLRLPRIRNPHPETIERDH